MGRIKKKWNTVPEEQQHKVSRSLSLPLTSLDLLALEIVLYGLVSYFAEKHRSNRKIYTGLYHYHPLALELPVPPSSGVGPFLFQLKTNPSYGYCPKILWSNAPFCPLQCSFPLDSINSHQCVKVKSLSHVRLFVTPWAVACRLLRPWDCPGKSTGVGCHYRTCYKFSQLKNRTRKPYIPLYLDTHF